MISDEEQERIQTLKNLKLLDTPIQEPFQRITRIAKTLFNVPITAFSLVDEERQWFKSTQGMDVCETSREVSFCGHAINQDDIFIVNDAQQDPRFQDNPLVTGEPHIRFYAGCPVRAPNGKKIGSLCVISHKPRAFSQQDKMLLRDLAKLVENEVAVSKTGHQTELLVKELETAKQAAKIDVLTRLYNRAGIEKILHEYLRQADKENKAFGIAVVDIDNFKKVNDTYGHVAGDAILKEVASQLLSGYRDEDIVGRWGGEEFVVLVNVSHKDKLFKVAERARKTIKQALYDIDGQNIEVAVTTGIALYEPHSHERVDDFVERADQALYKGKQSGKDKVVIGETYASEGAEV